MLDLELIFSRKILRLLSALFQEHYEKLGQIKGIANSWTQEGATYNEKNKECGEREKYVIHERTMNCISNFVPITSINGHASWSLMREGLHDAHFYTHYSLLLFFFL